MTRIALTELRRSNALAMAALIVAVSVAALATAVDLWLREWLKFTYNHATALFILVPLAMAGGAMLGRRERRTRAEELIASTGRPRWQRITPTAAAIAVAVAVAHLLVLTAGGILLAQTASYLSAGELLVPLTDVVILIGGAWLGLAAGRAWSSPLVPPALAVVSLVVQVGLTEISLDVTRLDNLALIVQPPSYDWEAVNGRAVLGHLALGAGLAAAGFLLAAAKSWRPRVAAVAVLAVATMTAAMVPGVGMAARYHVDTAAQRLVCADGTPQVCVTAVHAFALAQAAPDVRRALGLLAKLPGAPQRAVEWRADSVYEPGSAESEPPAVPVAPGTVQFELDLDGRQSDPHLVESIVYGGGIFRGGCAEGVGVAESAAGAWLMGTDDLVLDDGGFGYDEEWHAQIRDTVRKLRSLPEEEQTRRVTALRDAAAACRTDLLPILTGETHS